MQNLSYKNEFHLQTYSDRDKKQLRTSLLVISDTLYMSGFFKTVSSLRQNFFACLPAMLEKAGGDSVKEGRGRRPRGLATSCYHRGGPRQYPLGGGEGHREWPFAQ